MQDINMLHHKKRLKEITKLDTKNQLQNSMFRHSQVTKAPQISDKQKQMERNDMIYRENLRIFSNINTIMNRRSTSVSVIDQERAAFHAKQAQDKPEYYNHFGSQNPNSVRLSSL